MTNEIGMPAAIFISYLEPEQRTLPKKAFRFRNPKALDFLVDSLHAMHKGMDGATIPYNTGITRDISDGISFSLCYAGSRILNTVLSAYSGFSFDPLLDTDFRVMKSDGTLYKVVNYLIHHQEMREVLPGYDYNTERYILPDNKKGHDFADNTKTD